MTTERPRPARPTDDLPARAQVVVIGGGVVGASTAYHLARLGRTDVVLLEQGTLSCGTTWHAAGLVGQLRASESGTRLVQYSARLYARLEQETGLSTGYRQCGGVIVARTPDRMTQLRRTVATAEAFGLECSPLTTAEARERWPLMRTDDLLGAIWLPGDGRADPADLTQALAKGARMRGTRVLERTRVTGVLTAGGAVSGVRTDRGDIEAEVVVNCAGQWANEVGRMAGVSVPLHSAEHFYLVTDQVDGVRPDLPILRDPDGYTYLREEVGGLVVGGFEPEAKPWVSPDRIPRPFEFALLDEDWEHFSVLMDSAVLRVPALADDRDPQALQRSGELHPRQPVPAGGGAEPPWVLRRRRLQLGRDRLGGRRRAGARGVGGRGRADQRPARRGHPPLRAVPRQPPLAAGPGRRDSRAALRRPVAEP